MANIDSSIQKLSDDIRHLKTTIAELRDAEKERVKSNKGLMVIAVTAFLIPTVSVVWGGAQLSAKVDYLASSFRDVVPQVNDSQRRLIELGSRVDGQDVRVRVLEEYRRDGK